MPFFSGYHNQSSPPSYAEYRGRAHMEWLFWGLTALLILLIGAFSLGWREVTLFIQIFWEDVTHIIGFWAHPGTHLRPLVHQLRTHRVALGSSQYVHRAESVPHPLWVWHSHTPFSLWWIVVLGALIITGAAVFSWYRGQKGGRRALSRS